MSCWNVPSHPLLGISACASHSPSQYSPRNRRIRCMDAGGLDSDGREFKSADEMWREQVGDPNKKTQWYHHGVSYWQGVTANMDGVLGGFANVNEPDISCSEDFLNVLLSERYPDDARRQPLVALDCGSGIGRVTKNLLIRYFNEVDLLEPVSHFLEAAHETLALGGHMNSDMHKAVNFYCVPLQDFTPDIGRYDVIWVQWCIGHLTDEDFVSFFKRAKAGLKPGGLFVLKENIARSDGSSLRNLGRSGFGGVLWDCVDHWIFGFAGFIRGKLIFKLSYLAIYQDLCLIMKTGALQDLIYTSKNYFLDVDYIFTNQRIRKDSPKDYLL